MDEKEIFQLYEKLYFHEIDAREKLNARLNTSLTLIISFVGVLAFLLQNYGHREFFVWSVLFIALFAAAFLSLGSAGYYFVKTWWNNTYSFIPSAQDTEEYRQTLLELYAEYENGTELATGYFRNYLMSSYIKCSTVNTGCNDRRSLDLHKTNRWLVITTLCAFLSFLTFFVGGLDKAYIKKIAEVSIVHPVTILGGDMPGQPPNLKPQSEAPAPPPPPPLRLIREGVEIVDPKKAPPTSPKESGHGPGR